MSVEVLQAISVESKLKPDIGSINKLISTEEMTISRKSPTLILRKMGSNLAEHVINILAKGIARLRGGRRPRCIHGKRLDDAGHQCDKISSGFVLPANIITRNIWSNNSKKAA